ncbi:YheC/D like ATP-grasp [Natronincola peptidivorans]|uniref:YheC/D like ATP-grasp n=1 Tax=Natronincola peptidivorans TaxID=426128 RepID=A0A1H9YTS3_9FIRM|nr:YheC/YheD family protein [Natronincola peptidivorans]SES72560.1 YheC/D like ATP-grasp [Natronincola peptidivorans]
MDLRCKMTQYEILMKDPMVSKHIPHTKWYDRKTLMNMMDLYSTIYIKPYNKSRGNGIIRVKAANKNEYIISFETTYKKVDKRHLALELEQIMTRPKQYIIQQGIDLATYQECSFDMRIVLQKVNNIWRVTLTSAKVANSQDAIVTNVAKGAKDYLLHDILQQYDQKQNSMTIFREIIDFAHQIASILGHKLPLKITGIDIGIDKHGNLWFIESNALPACKQCKLVNDKLSIKKYEDANRLIGNRSRNKRSKK